MRDVPGFRSAGHKFSVLSPNICPMIQKAKFLSQDQWMKLQSDIGHFPSICGTRPNKNRYVLPNCLNDKCGRAQTYTRNRVNSRHICCVFRPCYGIQSAKLPLKGGAHTHYVDLSGICCARMSPTLNGSFALWCFERGRSNRATGLCYVNVMADQKWRMAEQN